MAEGYLQNALAANPGIIADLRQYLLGLKNTAAGVPTDLRRLAAGVGGAFSDMATDQLQRHDAFVHGIDPDTGKPAEQLTAPEALGVIGKWALGNNTASIVPEGALAAGVRIPQGLRGAPKVIAEATANEKPAMGLGAVPPSTGRPGGSVMGPTASRGRLGQVTLPDVLQEMQLQRQGADPSALPFSGKKGVVTPPEHINTLPDFNAAVGRYADLAQTGAPARYWYDNSGKAILDAASGDPQRATAFGASLARTSPQTDVASNTTHALTAYNQSMIGDPVRAGRFPVSMGKDLEKIYYGGATPTAEKIGPFFGGVAEHWDPDAFHHQFVNDIWNMRANEYGRAPQMGHNGGPPLEDTPQELYTGTPTAGQHNYARILADATRDELARRGDASWTPKQIQAATWTAVKAQAEGTPVATAGQDFSHGLAANRTQLSWESAPHPDSGDFPELTNGTATPAQRQEYHNAIVDALTDENGHDLLARHYGFLTGPTVEGSGYFEGQANPGSQSIVYTGQAKGGFKNGVDDASRTMLNSMEATRALLLRQKAFAWHKAVFRDTLKPGGANLADINLGRPINEDEAVSVAQAMHQQTGSTFFSPIATDSGFRLLNVQGASGIKNKDFLNHVQSALEKTDLATPGQDALEWKYGFADSGYGENDWKEQPNGQGYLQGIAASGRPDLQRRSEEILAALGPRVAAVQDDFAKRYGWTPNRASRIWENPDFIAGRQRAPDVTIPSPPQPWVQRPGPDSPGPMGLSGVAPSLFPLASSAPLTPQLPPLQAQTIPQ